MIYFISSIFFSLVFICKIRLSRPSITLSKRDDHCVRINCIFELRYALLSVHLKETTSIAQMNERRQGAKYVPKMDDFNERFRCLSLPIVPSFCSVQ